MRLYFREQPSQFEEQQPTQTYSEDKNYYEQEASEEYYENEQHVDVIHYNLF
jgi:hypothetical protein